VTIPATVPQGSKFPEGLMNNPVYKEDVRCLKEFCGPRNVWRFSNGPCAIKVVR
jgi:hypothetical protein